MSANNLLKGNTKVPAVVCSQLCFLTVQFGYDCDGVMQLLALEYTIVKDMKRYAAAAAGGGGGGRGVNTEVYSKKSVCSDKVLDAVAATSRFKSKLCIYYLYAR